MKINRFFGDGRHDIEMTFELAHAFERDNRKSMYATMKSLLAGDWRVSDVAEIIRLGLIGGGMDEMRAFELVESYVKGRPLAPSVKLANDVLEAAFFEPADPVKEEADRVFGAE